MYALTADPHFDASGAGKRAAPAIDRQWQTLTSFPSSKSVQRHRGCAGAMNCDCSVEFERGVIVKNQHPELGGGGLRRVEISVE